MVLPTKKKGEKKDTEMAVGAAGKILSGAIYLLTALFILAFFWQSILSLF